MLVWEAPDDLVYKATHGRDEYLHAFKGEFGRIRGVWQSECTYKVEFEWPKQRVREMWQPELWRSAQFDVVHCGGSHGGFHCTHEEAADEF